MKMLSSNNLKRSLLTFILLAVSCSPSATQNTIAGSPLPSAKESIGTVSAVEGSDVKLPCDSRPPVNNDSLLLVVWYRDDNPVYSYDTRVAGPSAHWMDDIFGNRATWLSLPTSALLLKDVKSKDRATYRCRVDYQVSPTRNFKVALDVIELPRKPVIFDEFGKEISAVAGPFAEGGNFKLTCVVEGGNPKPRIQWLQGENIYATLEPEENSLFGISRSLDLFVKNATRKEHSKVYTCTADNMMLYTSMKTSVRINLHLRPLSVEILSKEQPLSDGRKSELWCKSTGARPPAIITWWLGDQPLNSHTTKEEGIDVNETQSMLQWTPLKKHNGMILTCRARHTTFNYTSIESKLPLNIYYVPETTIKLGSKMNPNDLEEGDDVYFDCNVDANPPAYKVIWEHNDVLIQHNPASGVIVTGNNNLALRNISRHQAGRYTCTASNVEGDGKSKPLQVLVVYKPICRKKEVQLIGAAVQESSKVVCEVDAFPSADTFEWILNNSLGSIKVDPERFTTEAKPGRSVLTYTPISDVDYGTLSCRAINLAGQQLAPCFFTLLPATQPDAPTNCTVYNLTHDSLDLLCFAGYEGGLLTVYVVEVWAKEGLVTNSTNARPIWSLRRLGSKRHLRLVVFASNSRGKSEPVTFTLETAQRLSPRTEAQEAWEVNWAVGGVLGAAVVVASILCLALIATRVRQRRRDYEVAIQSSKTVNTAQPRRYSPQAPDDKNPDLIPLSKGIPEHIEPPSYSAVISSEAKHSVSSHSIVRTPATPNIYTQTQVDTNNSDPNGTLNLKREVVTTRTPLLAAHQESCV